MERTLCIIKPDAVKNRVQGHIIQKILDGGFDIIGLKLIQLTKEQAESFYAVHKERQFYKDLVDFMISGPCIPIALEKIDAVEQWRDLIGATDPAEAANGTIRKLFAKDKSMNAVHGSDSVENGRIEIAFFFNESNLI